jgi:hypothetical protein
MGFFKTKEQKEQIGAARSDYDDFVRTAAAGEPKKVREVANRFKSSPVRASLSDKERRKRGAKAFRAFAENVLADDFFTVEEEVAFSEVADALDVDQDAFESDFRDVLLRMAVARANDGRLSALEEAKLMTKKNEVVHMETPAALMKEAAVREWRSGSSGVSFRIAKASATTWPDTREERRRRDGDNGRGRRDPLDHVAACGVPGQPEDDRGAVLEAHEH